jgi:hypothetical protein
MEVERKRHLFCELLLQSYLPWLCCLQLLEMLGSSSSQILPLTHKPGPLLDCCSPLTPGPSTPLLPKPMRKGLMSITLFTPWMIWKHHNNDIFNGAQLSIASLVAKIKDEAALWARSTQP